MSLKRKSLKHEVGSLSSKSKDYPLKKTKKNEDEQPDSNSEQRIQLDNYDSAKGLQQKSLTVTGSYEGSVDRFLDSLKKEQRTKYSAKKEEADKLKEELEATKKNLDQELEKEQLREKEVINQPTSFKRKLKIARKEAKQLKNNDSRQENFDRQMHSLEELSLSLNQPRETATFGQLVRILSDTSNTRSSQRNLIENKWLKRSVLGPPFRLLRSQDSSLIIKDSDSQTVGTNSKPQKEQDNSQKINPEDSTPQLKPINILEEVSTNQHFTSKTKAESTLRSGSKEKRSQGFRSEENTPFEISNNLKGKFEETKLDSSITSRRKSKSVNTRTTPKQVSRKSEIPFLTPKSRKSSTNSKLSRNSTTPRNKSPSLESDLSNKELEACKSKLRRTLLEKEALENRLKYELDEKRHENSFLQTELIKLKSELQKSEHYRKKLHDSFQEVRGNLRIFCRVKPLQKETQKSIISYPEKAWRGTERFEEGLKTIDVKIKDRLNTFFFDHVFDDSSSQADVFDTIKPFFQSAIDGDQVCILAYGQTGSGKTYTLEGPDLIHSATLSDRAGVLPRAVDFIFKEVERLSVVTKIEVYISALEIYNETLHDLLSGETESSEKNNGGEKLTISFLKNRVQVHGLEWIKIQNNEQMLSLFSKATKNRATEKTGWNDRSSRSHSMYRIKIVSAKHEGLLNIVDLAGSERCEANIPGVQNQTITFTSTSNNAKKLQNEANFINKSLTTLGRIVRLIAERKPTTVLPYRESKLTRLLQDSLGGNAKTLLFINVCPSEENSFQTKESLKFSSKISL